MEILNDPRQTSYRKQNVEKPNRPAKGRKACKDRKKRPETNF